MAHLKRFFLFLMLLVLGACAGNQRIDTQQQGGSNPFQEYLDADDPAYRYESVHRVEGEGYTAHVLRMVSQRWLSEEQVDEPEWWHWLTVVVPDEVAHTTGLLWIGGGSKNTPAPSEAPAFLVQAALASRTVTAELHNVPFQPIRFAADTMQHRYEDDLIAFGWREFMERGARDEDAAWLARLPMTKAAIRAMDTITEYCGEQLGVQVDRYTVAGGSKRGWTTWTTGIFDERVVAIAPAVIDLLNVTPSFQHHWQAYGEWSPAIREYVHEGIMNWMDSAEFARLLELVDPFSYRNRLQLPKFIINAGSDEFFLPDSWQFYWNELQEPKHLRYVPNAGHGLRETDAYHSLISFHQRVVENAPMPVFDWNVERGMIHVRTDPANPPDEVRLWRATNPEARDFRLYVIGQRWTSEPVARSEDGHYRISVDQPAEGYTALFVEGTFAGGGQVPLKLTSGVVVTPDTYAYPPFSPDTPQGTGLSR